MQDLICNCNVVVYLIVCGRWFLSEQKLLMAAMRNTAGVPQRTLTFYEMDFQVSNFHELKRGITVKRKTTMMKCVGVN
jgi:hypothetical protein